MSRFHICDTFMVACTRSIQFLSGFDPYMITMCLQGELTFSQATMLKKSKNKIKRRNTEPSIYFPNDPLQPQSPSTDADSGPL